MRCFVWFTLLVVVALVPGCSGGFTLVEYHSHTHYQYPQEEPTKTESKTAPVDGTGKPLDGGTITFE